MAHAGTPTDLAKQPATSTSLGKLFLSAIVILALGVSFAISASFLSRASTAPTVDRGYDAIEKTRGALSLSGVTVDTSYDAVENLRALSGVVADTSYEAAEKARGAATLTGTSVWRCGNGLPCGAAAAPAVTVWRCGNGLPCGATNRP